MRHTHTIPDDSAGDDSSTTGPDNHPTFDRAFWDEHWRTSATGGAPTLATNAPNPYVQRETAGLPPGSALDAGCGAGAETLALADAGWRITAVDISTTALELATARAAAHGVGDRIAWIAADLVIWTPDTSFDLVMSHYAHPAMSQLAFYDRIARWVKPGGTLLLVGHCAVHDDSGHEHPADVAVTAESVVRRLDPDIWQIDTAEEPTRDLKRPDGRNVPLHDVVVRATRRLTV